MVPVFDCSILCGYRSPEEQALAFAAGRSKARPGQSPHNHSPALAVDVAPYPIDWSDRDRFHYFAGFVIAAALTLGIDLRWGGDWDRDTQTRDNRFDDLVHFELSDWRQRNTSGSR
ncbi:MAG: M15 family metallopeptidase [Magnetospiraceae bacterium]